MKNITKESIEQDLKVIRDMAFKYKEAFYENQEGQLAHFDNQSKSCKILMREVRCGLFRAMNALNYLSEIDIIED